MAFPQSVELTTPDGIVLHGQYWARGDDAALCIHGPERDLDDWGPLARGLSAVGVSCLAVDQRAHGLSGGTWAEGLILPDIQVALAWLRRKNAGRLILVSEGIVAGHSLKLDGQVTPDAMVLLTPVAVAHTDTASLTTCSKLVLVGGRDVAALGAVRQVFSGLTGPSVLMDLPTAEQGANLLATEAGDRVVESIVSFLAVSLGLYRADEVTSEADE